MTDTHGLCWNRTRQGVRFYRRMGPYLIPHNGEYDFTVRGLSREAGTAWFTDRLPFLDPKEQSTLLELKPMIRGKSYIGYSEKEGILVKGAQLYLRTWDPDFVQVNSPVDGEVDCYRQLKKSGAYSSFFSPTPFLTLLETGREGNDLYMVLPYIAGSETLDEYLGLGVSETSLFLVSETFRILNLLHACGVAHGDLKNPDNWLVKEDSEGNLRVYLIDLAGWTPEENSERYFKEDWYSLMNLLMDIVFLSTVWMSENLDEINQARFEDDGDMSPFLMPMEDLLERAQVRNSPHYEAIRNLYQKILTHC